MENLLTICLEAHNPGRNHHRWYEIRLGRDLFGEWTVCLLYGRVGRAGQLVRHAGPDPQRLRQVIQECLHRRLSAPKRIGCAYRVRQWEAAQDLDLAFWLPPDTLSPFTMPTAALCCSGREE